MEPVSPVQVSTPSHAIAVDENGWSDAVTGTMVDNILGPTFNGQPTTYNVQVKKNFTTNSYLIIDPWRGFFDQIGGEGQTSPSMEIDATDPSNLMITYTNTGINGGEAVGNYEVLSMSYWYFEDSLDCPEEYKIFVTEEGENTVITFPYHSMVLHASISGDYYYASLDESTITFPTISDEQSGIEDVIVNNDAKVEYFNLQGMRVENPAQGQILIKRQGTTVNKVIIR